jgi:hypothetical protein
MLVRVASCGLSLSLAMVVASVRGQIQTTTSRLLEQDASLLWLAGYSLHYEYCFHTDNLVSFRLCPDRSCQPGCQKGGEYLVDIEFFTTTFLSVQSERKRAACESILTNCQPAEEEDQEDSYENQCYASAGAYYCIEDDSVNDGQDFSIENYLSCREIGQNLYAGPYCGVDNHHIYLGVFTDDVCSVFAQDGAFEQAFGFSLPYGWYTQQSVVGDGCISCQGLDNDGQALEQCTYLYQNASGKCETHLNVESANIDACEDIKQMKKAEGIRGARKGGSIVVAVLVALALAGIILVGLWHYRTKQLRQTSDGPATSKNLI